MVSKIGTNNGFRQKKKERSLSEVGLSFFSLVTIYVIFSAFSHWLAWTDDRKHYRGDMEKFNVEALVEYTKNVVYIDLITIFGLYMIMGACYYIKIDRGIKLKSIESVVSILFIAASFCFFGTFHYLNSEMIHQLYMAMYDENAILLFLDVMALTVMVAGSLCAYIVLATAFRANHEGKDASHAELHETSSGILARIDLMDDGGVDCRLPVWCAPGCCLSGRPPQWREPGDRITKY